MIEVLLVEDDAQMRGLLAEWLSEAGYRVRQAENGTNALKMLRIRPVDLLATVEEVVPRDKSGAVRV